MDGISFPIILLLLLRKIIVFRVSRVKLINYIIKPDCYKFNC